MCVSVCVCVCGVCLLLTVTDGGIVLGVTDQVCV